MLLTNIVDNFQKGAFLPSYLKTLREVFGDKNVHLVSVNPNFKNIGISTFIVIAGNGNLDINDFNRYSKSQGDGTSYVVPEEVMDDFLSKRHSVVLRDDYVPVDNLLAPVFEERFEYDRKN
jgi:hypothetical protein